MRDIAYFTSHVVNCFDNNYDNMVQFAELLTDASNRVYTKYNKEQTGDIIRNQFNKILGCDFKSLSSMKQRQAWRSHSKEIASLIEDVVVSKMNSGWNAGNARFMDLVREINLADGDQNEFYVEDTSILQVSKFAGDHHDVKF